MAVRATRPRRLRSPRVSRVIILVCARVIATAPLLVQIIGSTVGVRSHDRLPPVLRPDDLL
jgi:hypothetical protein